MSDRSEGLLSVIVPVYNAERALKRCLESILSSDYDNLELILVDDGSKDNSGKICEDIARSDQRVRVFHKENGGPSSARNMGIEKSRGHYIAYIDADDVVEKDMFSVLINEIERDDLVAAECRWREVPETGEAVIGELTAFGSLDVGDVRRILPVNSRSVGAGFLWNMVFNAEKICNECGAIPLFNPECHWYEDVCYQLSVFRSVSPRDKIAILDHIGYNYYIYNNSASHGNSSLSKELDIIYSFEYMKSLLEDIPREDFKQVNYILTEYVFGLAWDKRKYNDSRIWEKYRRDYLFQGGVRTNGKKDWLKKHVKMLILFVLYTRFCCLRKLVVKTSH